MAGGASPIFQPIVAAGTPGRAEMQSLARDALGNDGAVLGRGDAHLNVPG
jgi:hypothetical protein